MQPVQLSLIPDPVPTPITGPVLVVELTPMVEQLPTEAVATAAAAMGSGVISDE